MQTVTGDQIKAATDAMPEEQKAQMQAAIDKLPEGQKEQAKTLMSGAQDAAMNVAGTTGGAVKNVADTLGNTVRDVFHQHDHRSSNLPRLFQSPAFCPYSHSDSTSHPLTLSQN